MPVCATLKDRVRIFREELHISLMREQAWLMRLTSGITFLTIDEVVEYCSKSYAFKEKERQQPGFSRSKVQEAIKSGELQSAEIGGSRRVTAPMLSAWLKEDDIAQTHRRNIKNTLEAINDMNRLFDSLIESSGDQCSCQQPAVA
jgi:hypothetical protein